MPLLIRRRGRGGDGKTGGEGEGEGDGGRVFDDRGEVALGDGRGGAMECGSGRFGFLRRGVRRARVVGGERFWTSLGRRLPVGEPSGEAGIVVDG